MESNAKNKNKFLSIILSMALVLVIISLLFVLFVSHKEATEYTYKRLFDKSALEPKQNYPDYKVLQRESLYSKQTIIGQVSKVEKGDNGYTFTLSAAEKDNLDIFIPNTAEVKIKRQTCTPQNECDYLFWNMSNITYGGLDILFVSENISELEDVTLEDIKKIDNLFIQITKRIDTKNELFPSYLIIIRSFILE